MDVRVVACGEALIDLVGDDAEGDRWHAAVGGAPLNAAVAAARLGAPTSFLGVLSRDRFGQRIAAHLDASLVEHSGCPVTSEPTTLAIVTQAPGEGEPAFAFHVAGTTTVSPAIADIHMPPDVGILHVSGSVSLVLEPAASRLEALLVAARHRALVHLDPNPRPALAGGRTAFASRFARWRRSADVVKVSAADLAWLYPGADPVQVARSWLGLDDDTAPEDHPVLVLITRGAAGATAVRSSGVIEVAGEGVEVVDTVGAGDTFVGAMLAALAARGITRTAQVVALSDQWLATAMTYAVQAAGITCTRIGADPPWRSELHRPH